MISHLSCLNVYGQRIGQRIERSSRPSLRALPRWCPQFAHLCEVLTVLKLLLSDTAGNNGSAMGIYTVGEVRTRDADPLAAAVRQVVVIHIAPLLHAVPSAVVQTY